MSSEHYSTDIEIEEEEFDAVNDEEFSPKTRTKSDSDTRRRVEALLEERRLKQLIDDWDDWDEQ
ncbi:PA3496 family putative envelope integrity protein [Carnimonas bestiolae]|uniref:PA3496 family putative envelope integrity protein n=1 Tax=Carnimonas bestiolae TaxID=3402172 RepID=UPI003EDB8AC7